MPTIVRWVFIVLALLAALVSPATTGVALADCSHSPGPICSG